MTTVQTAERAPAPTSSLPSPPVGPGAVPGRSAVGVVATIVAGAALWDLALRSRAGGTAAFAAVLTLCAGLARSGWVRRRGGRVLLRAAVVVAGFLVLRSSPWLVAADLATIAVLLALACTAESGAGLFRVRFSAVARRLLEAVGALIVGVGALAATFGALLPERRGGTVTGSIARGLLLAAPIVAVLGVGLATADAVFASLVQVELDLTGVVPHLVVLGGATWVSIGWFVLATRPPVRSAPSTPWIGSVEALVVMCGLCALYAAFAASQLLVARRGPDYVQQATGLTYADYARSGFFQLLWVAAATAVVLLVLGTATRPAGRGVDRLLRATGVLAAASTLVVVHAALVRLGLYEDAFGATLLRVAASTTAWWLGAVFVVIGASFLVPSTRPRSWLPTALGCVTLATVLVVNTVDPEHRVVAHNLERARDGESFDVSYAMALSADSVPVLVEGLQDLDPTESSAALRELCARHGAGPTRWNVAERRAARLLDERCG
ncbi:MAG: DUF4153 domain-containing protein [Microthrixaceae bacterium]